MGKSLNVDTQCLTGLLGGEVNYSGTGTTFGDPFDIANGQGNAVLMLAVGNRSGTSPTLDVNIQESDDGSTGWTDTGIAFAQITGTSGFEKVTLNLDQTKRFIRFKTVIGGSAGVTWTAFITAVAGVRKLPAA